MKICDVCGKPITFGYMTDDEGGLCTHEGECFEKYMDESYGKHQWMSLDCSYEHVDHEPVTDEYGGYYLVAFPNENGFEGTGIYYTELQEGDEDWIEDEEDLEDEE